MGYQYIGERVLRLAAVNMVTYPFLGGFWLAEVGDRSFILYEPGYGIITIDDWVLSTPDELAEYAKLTFSTAKRFVSDDMTVGPDDELISEHARVRGLAELPRPVLQPKNSATLSHFPVIAFSSQEIDRLLQLWCKELFRVMRFELTRGIDDFVAFRAGDYKKTHAVISALFPEYRCPVLDQLPFPDEKAAARFLETLSAPAKLLRSNQ